MIVKELINKLQKLPNKQLPVRHEGCCHACNMPTLKVSVFKDYVELNDSEK